jgi:hypothetical protein
MLFPLKSCSVDACSVSGILKAYKAKEENSICAFAPHKHPGLSTSEWCWRSWLLLSFSAHAGRATRRCDLRINNPHCRSRAIRNIGRSAPVKGTHGHALIGGDSVVMTAIQKPNIMI